MSEASTYEYMDVTLGATMNGGEREIKGEESQSFSTGSSDVPFVHSISFVYIQAACVSSHVPSIDM